MAFPGTYNFSYYRGDTFPFIVRPKDANGDPFSLTGFSSIFTVATGRGAGATQYEMVSVVNVVDDIVTCTIPAATGRNLVGGTGYVYDVQITDGASIYTILNGAITVTDDITGAV